MGQAVCVGREQEFQPRGTQGDTGQAEIPVGQGGFAAEKRKRLAAVDLWVLDNSLRESIVGQVMGQTKAEKMKVFNEVLKVGFKDIILGAFGASRQVDDEFVKDLFAMPELPMDLHCYGFTEDSESLSDGRLVFDEDHIPSGLQKMKELGIMNPIIEVDFGEDTGPDWQIYTVRELVEGISFLMRWSRRELKQAHSSQSGHRVLINIRDFSAAMVQPNGKKRMLEFVDLLAQLPPAERPFGLLCEDPIGIFFPEEVSAIIARVRATMNKHSWKAPLAIHVHKQWGLGDAVSLDALANGADGIWCSLAEEGAGLGHVCSTVMIANLARLGNQKVLKKFNTEYLAKASTAITELTTGQPPSHRQIVYGPRAVEAVFDFPGVAGTWHAATHGDANCDGHEDELDRFTLAGFFGLDEAPIRMNKFSSPAMVIQKLTELFGSSDLFTEEHVGKMKTIMTQDLIENRKIDYNTPIGLAVLFNQADPKKEMPPGMQNFFDKQADAEHPLIQQLLESFTTVARAENFYKQAGRLASVDPENPMMSFQNFYNAFLQPYFGCFTCPTTKSVCDILDRTDDNLIEWKEWRMWLTWALHMFEPTIKTSDDLIGTVVRKAFIPHFLGQEKAHRY